MGTVFLPLVLQVGMVSQSGYLPALSAGPVRVHVSTTDGAHVLGAPFPPVVDEPKKKGLFRNPVWGRLFI